ncbi:MAG: hypothetical protein ACREB8_01880 [Pseudolabrys sp.]
MRRIVLVALLGLLPLSAQGFDMTRYRNGGKYADFLPVISQFNSSGERFPITGVCKSACTMFLSIRNVCVSPSARFYFHAGKGRGTVDQHQTNVMLSTYNSALQGYIRDHHMMETNEFQMLPGSTIIKLGYPACR